MYLIIPVITIIFLIHYRIPDTIVNITSLTHLYMNDVALPALPREIGKLVTNCIHVHVH